MPIPCARDDREQQKFKENTAGCTGVGVQGIGSLLEGVSFNDVEMTASTSTTETFTYRLNGTDVATVLLTYTDSTKECFERVQRTDL